MADKIRVKFRSGSLVLDLSSHDWKWKTDNVRDKRKIDAICEVANLITTAYDYSPTHGEPGYMLAHEVANKLNGKAETPPAPEINPNEVY